MININASRYPLPTKRQEEWADCELGVIIHYCLETYNPEIPINEFKCSRDKLPPEIFKPKTLDTDQWLKSAKEMGATYAVFVANHVTGFSLWPTKLNDYSIASSPYVPEGTDLVADFVKSCKKYDIRPGLYYSTGCNGYYEINDDTVKPEDYKSQRYQDYIKVVEAQIKELWSNYGKLFEIWFDGGIVPYEEGGPNILPLLEKYQPEAICFQGPVRYGTNVRWVGNERGLAPRNCWSTHGTNTCAFGGDEEDREIGLGHPEGEHWMPAESDMGNRAQDAFGGGWGWLEGEKDKVLSPEHLLDCYYHSVGRNSNLLMGMAISTDGDFKDVEQFKDFGKLVRDIYKEPIAEIRGMGDEFELVIQEDRVVGHLIIKEDIHYGERVREYIVEIEDDQGWHQIFEAKCIGHKRIVKIDKKVKKIRLKIKKAVDTPIMKSVIAYA